MGAAEYLEQIRTIRLDLLELFGSGYVIDHCVSAFSKKKEKEKEKELENEKLKACIYYFADCIRLITENTAKSAHTEASYTTNNLRDILNLKPIVQKTGDEIAQDIIQRAGLKAKGGMGNDTVYTSSENFP